MCIRKPIDKPIKELKYQDNNLCLDNILNRLNVYNILNKYALKQNMRNKSFSLFEAPVTIVTHLHETNYVLGKHCLRSTKKKNAFYIEIRALVMTNTKSLGEQSIVRIVRRYPKMFNVDHKLKNIFRIIIL